MTLLASWVAVDSRKPSAMYICSDSRVSWENGKKTFDSGKKVYACKKYPEIFGYCGDVLFPTIVLEQLVDAIDSDLVFVANWSYRKKTAAIIKRFKDAFSQYPNDSSILNDTFEVLYGTRDVDGQFFFIDIMWNRKGKKKWTFRKIPFEKYSYKLKISGSGGPEFKRKYESYLNEPSHRTSRAMFQTFCDTLTNIKDWHCGGAPQLVGLYCKPKSAGREYGIIYKNRRYYSGMQIDSFPSGNLDNIEWRNELFEICDPKTKRRKKNAQAQPYDKMK